MNENALMQLNFTVLVVDDDDVAIEGIVRSLRKSRIDCHIVSASDGLEALEILNRQHETKNLKRHFIILLDLEMPRMDGFTFLEHIRRDPSLTSAVVFVLTTSSRDADRARAYNDHIAGYMVKSAVGPQFSKLVEFLKQIEGTIFLP